MKSKQKANIIILVLGLIFAISTISNYNFIDDQDNSEDSMEIRDETNLKRPKKSAIYPETLIHIDGSISDNWSLTESTYDWCSGDGSWGNPYIIENVTIDAGGLGSGILIENSRNVYFIIRNCNVTNAGSIAQQDAGIKLKNTCNGTLINNNCSDNGMYGIHLRDSCGNNTLSGNIASNFGTNNQRNGIFIQNYCDNNTISGNFANDNSLYGIRLEYSDNNTLSGNTINYNGDRGLWLRWDSDNNAVSGNNIDNNKNVGIHISDDCHDNIISGNNVDNNKNGGIYISNDCHDNMISGNTANYNGFSGIALETYCEDNTITENIVYENDYGIHLIISCDNNLLFYNCIFNNTLSNGFDSESSSNWDNGTIGNYWGNYTGIDTNYDGIGDTPYTILGAGNKDNRPLMNYNPFFFKPPDDLTYEIGTEGNIIGWTIINISPKLLPFNVYRDGTSIKTGGVFYGANEIVISVDALDGGIYGFTIEVADGNGGTFTDGIWVTATSNSNSNPSPVIIIIEEDNSNDDKNDDGEEEIDILRATLMIVGITSAVFIAGVVIYLIRKRHLKLER